MKKGIITLLTLLLSINAFALEKHVAFGVDLGYGLNYPWGNKCSQYDPLGLQMSNGINFGVLNTTDNFVWGMQLFWDVDGRMPTDDMKTRLVDIAGCVRLGYEFNGIGLGIDVGGYRMVYQYLGKTTTTYVEYYDYMPYYQHYYHAKARVVTYTTDMYATQTYFNAGVFLYYRFYREGPVAPYVMAESTHANPIMITVGVTFVAR